MTSYFLPLSVCLFGGFVLSVWRQWEPQGADMKLRLSQHTSWAPSHHMTPSRHTRTFLQAWKTRQTRTCWLLLFELTWHTMRFASALVWWGQKLFSQRKLRLYTLKGLDGWIYCYVYKHVNRYFAPTFIPPLFSYINDHPYTHMDRQNMHTLHITGTWSSFSRQTPPKWGTPPHADSPPRHTVLESTPQF